MKQKYDKYLIRFYVCLLMLAFVSIAWSIAKSYLIKWNIFTINIITLNIYIGLIVGIYFIYFCFKEFLYYKKYGKLIHGYDERNARVVSSAIRNAGLVIIILLLGASYYYSLFNDFNVLLFSVNSISYLLLVSGIVFFISFWHYYKKRDL